MRKLVTVLMAAGVMAGAGTMATTSAQAHWRDRGCCSHYKKVRYYKPVYKKVVFYKPVTKLVKKVKYYRVRSYETVYVKKLYRDRFCDHNRRYYRTVRYFKPVDKVVPKVVYYRVRAYKPYVVTKRVHRRWRDFWR